MGDAVKFYIGLHNPAHAVHFERAMISVKRVWNRRKPISCRDWILDSGAFTELAQYGDYRFSAQAYADQIRGLAETSPPVIAVSQDWMCEPMMLRRTGLSVREHQRRTIDRYDQLIAAVGGAVPIMPVLQGYEPEEYVDHLADYGVRLPRGSWVGVGSVCKRNARPREIIAVLRAIKDERPDLRLHGFGVKVTALADPEICASFATADSMAWSFAARREGRGPDANRWQEARCWLDRLDSVIRQAKGTGDHPGLATTLEAI